MTLLILSSAHFSCDTCTYTCRMKQQLRRHLLTAHGRSLGYDCKQCKAVFDSLTQLKEHRATCQNVWNMGGQPWGDNG